MESQEKTKYPFLRYRVWKHRKEYFCYRLSQRSGSCRMILEKYCFIENNQLVIFWTLRIETSIYSQKRKEG